MPCPATGERDTRQRTQLAATQCKTNQFVCECAQVSRQQFSNARIMIAPSQMGMQWSELQMSLAAFLRESTVKHEMNCGLKSLPMNKSNQL
jgi:hypothetical protein